MARTLFYAVRRDPRFPGSLLVYGGLDPLTNEPTMSSNVDPMFEQILAEWRKAAPTYEPISYPDCQCEAPCEDNNFTGYVCRYHETVDPRGD